MQGSKMLKVVGILMIVFGAIALVMEIIAIAGMSVLEATLGTALPTGAIWFALIVALVGCIAEFVAGIIGVASWQKPEKAKTCIVWGIIIIALTVVSNVVTLIAYPDSFSIFSVFTGLVLPVLYLIGAFKLKAPEAAE